MRCPQLGSFLCCSLRTGVLVIAITCLVLNTLGAIFFAYVLASPSAIRAAVMEDPSILDDDEPAEEQLREIVQGVHVLFGLGLASAIVCLVMDVALLVAFKKDRPRPMFVWCIWYSLVSAGMIGYSLYMTVLMIATSDTSPDLWFHIMTMLASGGTGIYFILVVNSYHRILKERGNGGGYFLQPVTTA
ncbi:hypothetical protein FJT64_008692 [Amphibalanus amphitrite]|uniref:Uncharacterized protein n=1 Tax=Amphibalanus amphitrite TaxID=1232801 RepID=A0A6A4VIY5_AMPAM|nr:uncharacterized protein LOC122366690 [Amphibalanus amphitrite]KAF0293553.1 hypothetical protein FJT64_008692 [Amphibalanus amphitrite]